MKQSNIALLTVEALIGIALLLGGIKVLGKVILEDFY